MFSLHRKQRQNQSCSWSCDLQGVVHWQPPQNALEKVKELVWDPTISSYGPDEGIPELRLALQRKVTIQET